MRNPHEMANVLLAVFLSSLAACTTVKESNPARTATEELLISSAADRAADSLVLDMPAGTPIFIDSSTFDGTDSKYALGALTTSLLRQGARLVDDKKKAVLIIQVRAGALSTDQKNFLIGIPSFNIPIPLASAPLTFPEIALYANDSQQGVAKFAVNVINAKNGKQAGMVEPQFGFSHDDKKTAAIFISWRDDDILPENAK